MASTIHIDDLASPRLTPSQMAAIQFGESQATKLTVDAVLSASVERVGLEDFGADDFVDRLDLWLSEMGDDPERTGFGRFTMFSDCVRWAGNRLRVVDLLHKHPEIHDIEIRRPIIVVGLPRSGTTHLVNLLAADERLRSMPLWESLEPIPDEHERLGPHSTDPRWQRCNRAWEHTKALLPLLEAMHPMHPDHIHEELELQNSDFSSYHPEWVGRSPRWRDYYLSHDQTRHYQWLLVNLKILQWFRPGERWVLKSPQHLEQLGPLLATFPDATVVMTHRDPVSVVQSAATMLTYSARLSYHGTRPDFYIEYWWDRVRRLLEASVRDRDLLPANQCCDVLFHEFMEDDLATVERIYEVAGLTMTSSSRQQALAYIASHPRGRDGRVLYDLRSDFGVAPNEVREDFQFYVDRYPIRIEVE